MWKLGLDCNHKSDPHTSHVIDLVFQEDVPTLKARIKLIMREHNAGSAVVVGELGHVLMEFHREALSDKATAEYSDFPSLY